VRGGLGLRSRLRRIAVFPVFPVFPVLPVLPVLPAEGMKKPPRDEAERPDSI